MDWVWVGRAGWLPPFVETVSDFGAFRSASALGRL